MALSALLTPEKQAQVQDLSGVRLFRRNVLSFTHWVTADPSEGFLAGSLRVAIALV